MLQSTLHIRIQNTTKSRFCENPFSAAKNSKMYFTIVSDVYWDDGFETASYKELNLKTQFDPENWTITASIVLKVALFKWCNDTRINQQIVNHNWNNVETKGM